MHQVHCQGHNLYYGDGESGGNSVLQVREYCTWNTSYVTRPAPIPSPTSATTLVCDLHAKVATDFTGLLVPILQKRLPIRLQVLPRDG